ncbi:MAG: recombination protein O N-terminal domain-containing protein [Patescibacteria group bacterium]
MYAIHTTPGFIIESRPKGEAGKLLYIFTRDLGLVMASAQGIRLEKSKLRYHSQEFSLGEFSFVRGKEFWRMTNAQASKNVISGIVPRVALLLRRLLHGEEAHPELFDHVEESFDFIKKNIGTSLVSDEHLRALESLIVFRIVHLLGYVGTDKDISVQMISAPLTIELLDTVAGHRVAMNKHINKALRESQL